MMQATTRGGVRGMLPMACSFTHSGNQATTTAVVKTLAFDTTSFDYLDARDLADNTKLRVRFPGIYQAFVMIRWGASAVGERELVIVLSNTTTIAALNVSAVTGGVLRTDQHIWSRPVVMARGDYIEALCQQNTGGNLNVEAGAGYSPYFGLVRVGAARVA